MTTATRKPAGYILERSNFGGPWKPHSMGQWVDTYGPRTRENFRPYTLEEATELADYLNSLDHTRSGARIRIAPVADAA
jgi:hypothetical protein